jgi:hypothetical protein
VWGSNSRPDLDRVCGRPQKGSLRTPGYMTGGSPYKPKERPCTRTVHRPVQPIIPVIAKMKPIVPSQSKSPASRRSPNRLAAPDVSRLGSLVTRATQLQVLFGVPPLHCPHATCRGSDARICGIDSGRGGLRVRVGAPAPDLGSAHLVRDWCSAPCQSDGRRLWARLALEQPARLELGPLRSRSTPDGGGIQPLTLAPRCPSS